jgi:hypothetical protein
MNSDELGVGFSEWPDWASANATGVQPNKTLYVLCYPFDLDF